MLGHINIFSSCIPSRKRNSPMYRFFSLRYHFFLYPQTQ